MQVSVDVCISSFNIFVGAYSAGDCLHVRQLKWFLCSMSFLYTVPLYAKEGLALLPVTRPLGTLLSVQSHWHAKEP